MISLNITITSIKWTSLNCFDFNSNDFALFLSHKKERISIGENSFKAFSTNPIKIKLKSQNLTEEEKQKKLRLPSFVYRSVFVSFLYENFNYPYECDEQFRSCSEVKKTWSKKAFWSFVGILKPSATVWHTFAQLFIVAEILCEDICLRKLKWGHSI